MICMIEGIRAVPGKSKELGLALQQLVPLSLKETGCLRYEIFHSDKNPEEFLVIMEYKTKANLKAHDNSEFIQEFVAKYENVLYAEVFLCSTWIRGN